MPIKVLSIYNGPPGRSVFTYPFSFREPAKLSVMDLIKLQAQAADDRSNAVISAMLIENRIDALLEAMMPAASVILDNRNFSFSMRIDILKGMQLVPARLTYGADVIRQVRNEFAHSLEVTSFSALKPGILDKLRQAKDQCGGFEVKDDPASHFNEVTRYALGGLDSYLLNVRTLRKRLFHPAFEEELLRESGSEWLDVEPVRPVHHFGRDWSTGREVIVNGQSVALDETIALWPDGPQQSIAI